VIFSKLIPLFTSKVCVNFSARSHPLAEKMIV
jgi:hypothetical protein